MNLGCYWIKRATARDPHHTAETPGYGVVTLPSQETT